MTLSSNLHATQFAKPQNDGGFLHFQMLKDHLCHDKLAKRQRRISQASVGTADGLMSKVTKVYKTTSSATAG